MDMTKKAFIFLADGFEDVEAVTVIDLLRRAGVDIKTVSVSGTGTVTTSHGITMQTDLNFDDADYSGADILILPGGMPGTTNLGACEPLTQLLVSFCGKGGRIAAICAAPTVFGKLGLLKDKTATCYPGLEEKLSCKEWSSEPVVTDGNVTTSRGVGTAIPFALELISLLVSKETADGIASSIVY